MIRRTSHKGFTLVELLVVIAIIMILVAIATAFTTRVLQETRDRERASDVSVIMEALETYYTKNGEYPPTELFNPSFASSKLPNYSATKATLPLLSDESLKGPLDYNFFAPACTSMTCSESPADRLQRPKQYIYMSWRQNIAPGVYNFEYASSGNMWGCRLWTNDSDPGFAIAFRSEATGLWTFKKGKYGTISIGTFGSGPISPQTCAFS